MAKHIVRLIMILDMTVFFAGCTDNEMTVNTDFSPAVLGRNRSDTELNTKISWFGQRSHERVYFLILSIAQKKNCWLDIRTKAIGI